MMTRKHYRAMAEALNDTLRRGKGAKPTSEFSKGVAWTVKSLTDELAHICKQDNIHFDRERFIDAVYEGNDR